MSTNPQLSVVVPVFNEQDNVAPLVHEITAALRGVAGLEFEIVYVDDCSKDGTLAELRALKAARGQWIATLDGDGQNDPADLPRLLAHRDSAGPDVKLFAGWRVDRKDTGSKRWASKWANAIRSRMLHDATPDTGCGTKLFERAAFLDLPHFNHMHRYLPALMQRAGWKTLSVPVNHRARSNGVSKYNNLNRALVGISDLLGVAWLIRRGRVTRTEEV